MRRNHDRNGNKQDDELSSDLLANKEAILHIIGHNSDVVVREIFIGGSKNRATIIYVEGLVDRDLINQQVVRTLLQDIGIDRESKSTTVEEEVKFEDSVSLRLVELGKILQTDSLPVCIDSILVGNTSLLIEGMQGSFILGTSKWKSRNIEEPVSESVVRGPREGFVENLTTNLSLLRRRLKTPNRCY